VTSDLKKGNDEESADCIVIWLLDMDSALRERVDRARKEAEFSKKKLQQQHEEEIEEFEAAKKQLERKVWQFALFIKRFFFIFYTL